MRAHSSWLLGAALWASVLCLLPGCGAKTGLEVPDASRDSGRDAGVDAPMRDASVDAAIPCFELDPDGGPLDLPLDTEVQVGRADVVFLIDVTGSMDQEIERIRDDLSRDIAPGIQRSIEDSQIGVATLADFPEGDCGDEGDVPFRLVLPVTDDVTRVQAAVNSIGMSSGGDPAESQVEALFQTATGQGISPYVPASFGCPRGGFGYPCFRDDALPVILLFTDDEFHNGPSGLHDYGVGPRPSCSPRGPHTYEDARTALTDRGIRVMGLFSGSSSTARAEMERIARDTGAVESGNPLVFDIGSNGDGLTASVIDSIRTLASVIEFDIDTVLVDPDPRDGVDPRDFVESIVPLRAEPMDGIASIDFEAGVFRGVQTGTRVVFQMRLRNGVVAPGVGPQHFTLEIVFRGDERTRIASRLIDIVVPGADGSGCP